MNGQRCDKMSSAAMASSHDEPIRQIDHHMTEQVPLAMKKEPLVASVSVVLTEAMAPKHGDERVVRR